MHTHSTGFHSSSKYYSHGLPKTNIRQLCKNRTSTNASPVQLNHEIRSKKKKVELKMHLEINPTHFEIIQLLIAQHPKKKNTERSNWILSPYEKGKSNHLFQRKEQLNDNKDSLDEIGDDHYKRETKSFHLKHKNTNMLKLEKKSPLYSREQQARVAALAGAEGWRRRRRRRRGQRVVTAAEMGRRRILLLLIFFKSIKNPIYCQC